MNTVALIGAGRMGRIHAENIARCSAARLRYVVDLIPSRALALAQRHGAEAASLDTALSDDEVNSVVISASTPAHVELAMACAAAGKAIFCEKPIALCLEDVDRCLAVIQQTGVPFTVGFQRRFDPTFQKIRDAVAEGVIGDVEVLRITSRDPVPHDPRYVADSGGLFRDMMIHDFDMARWLMDDEPVELFSMGSCLVDPKIGEMGDVDTAVVILKTAAGRLCYIENSRRAVYGYDQRLEVFGSRGMLQAANRTATSIELWTAQGVTHEKPLYFFPERYTDAYAAEIAHFLKTVAEGTRPDIGGEAGRQSLVLADAAQLSLTEGRPVSLG